MYWIQETSAPGINRANFRMYHCDYKTDIAKLPTNTTKGVQQGTDEASCTLAHYGDQCLCLEDSSVYELGYESNQWQEL